MRVFDRPIDSLSISGYVRVDRAIDLGYFIF